MLGRLTNERGAILAFAAIAMVAFLSFAVVGVDLARVAFTATEAQTAADAAATAGVNALIRDGDVVAQAQSVALQNTIDGLPASLAADAIELGHYEFATHSFIAGLTPHNAVRATAQTTISNFVAAVLGNPSTVVTKAAIAAAGGVGADHPVLPIVVGECHFDDFQDSMSCADLPSLRQVPNTSQNSGWTSLSANPASTTAVRDYLPNSCGGLGLPSPMLRTGDYINVTGGQNATVLKVIDDCVRQGKRAYVIPVVPCGQYNQAMRVQGFATIHIDSVKATGNNKGLNLTAICRTDTGPVTGESFGTTSVAMVR